MTICQQLLCEPATLVMMMMIFSLSVASCSPIALEKADVHSVIEDAPDDPSPSEKADVLATINNKVTEDTSHSEKADVSATIDKVTEDSSPSENADVLADEFPEDPSLLALWLYKQLGKGGVDSEREVVVLESLNEEKLNIEKGPFHIARVLSLMMDLVEKEVLGGDGGQSVSSERRTSMCSAVCGREKGGVMNLSLCLGCVGLVNSHLKPIPISEVI